MPPDNNIVTVEGLHLMRIDNLRSGSRYANLLRSMGLPQ
jgi:hypothetical protein